MKLKIIALICCLSQLPLAEARCQTVWHITHPDVVGNTNYVFTALAGKGSWVTAAANIRDYSDTTHRPYDWRLAFLRSNDGGESWVEQLPNLPRRRDQSYGWVRQVLQIDSLNVVAIGDTGFVLRTFDGGVTWEQQDCHTKNKTEGIHFSDPLNGILLTAGSTTNWVTADGGRHWDSTRFEGLGYWQGRTSGTGKYQIFSFGHGQLFSTVDNWSTVDSTKLVYDSIADPKFRKVLRSCNFGNDGTNIAYGTNLLGDSIQTPRPLFARTTDKGLTWRDTTFVTPGIGGIGSMTSIASDTVVAGGNTFGKLLISRDRGGSWVADTMLVPDGIQMNYVLGLSINNAGHIVGAFEPAPLPGVAGYLAVGQIPALAVTKLGSDAHAVQLFPNPTSDQLRVRSDSSFRSVHLLDLLGRTMLSGTLDEGGQATLDVASLPRGVYEVMVESRSGMVPVGRVVLVGR